MRSPLAVDLDDLFVSSDFLLRFFSEDLLSFNAFHVSVTFISALR